MALRESIQHSCSAAAWARSSSRPLPRQTSGATQYQESPRLLRNGTLRPNSSTSSFSLIFASFRFILGLIRLTPRVQRSHEIQSSVAGPLFQL